jgi:hypothetical protein
MLIVCLNAQIIILIDKIRYKLQYSYYSGKFTHHSRDSAGRGEQAGIHNGKSFGVAGTVKMLNFCVICPFRRFH